MSRLYSPSCSKASSERPRWSRIVVVANRKPSTTVFQRSCHTYASASYVTPSNWGPALRWYQVMHVSIAPCNSFSTFSCHTGGEELVTQSDSQVTSVEAIIQQDQFPHELPNQMPDCCIQSASQAVQPCFDIQLPALGCLHKLSVANLGHEIPIPCSQP